MAVKNSVALTQALARIEQTPKSRYKRRTSAPTVKETVFHLLYQKSLRLLKKYLPKDIFILYR